MTLILTVATLISRFLGEVVDALIILAMVLLSGLLGYWQEQSAANWLELGEPQRWCGVVSRSKYPSNGSCRGTWLA